jgi:1-deoxy-D-xylulose-5-phosphate synthase
MQALQIGRGRVLRQGRRVALLGFGSPVAACLEAAEALDATVADMRFVKPLDLALLRELAASHELLVTVEDGTRMGGAGSAVAETLAAADDAPRLLILGLPDAFLEHGAREELLSDSGLDAAGIERAIHEQLPEVDCPAPASRVIS